MGMFFGGCPRCWDSYDYCKCTPAEMEAYNIQAEINRNTPTQRKTPTLDGLQQQLKAAITKTNDDQRRYSGLYRDWNAEPIPNPDYKPAPNTEATGVVFLKNDELPSRKKELIARLRESNTKTADELIEQLIHPTDIKPGPIILVSTSGDDYEVLNKVDPRIKELALAGKLTLSEVGNVGVRLSLREEDGSPRYCQLAKNETFRPIKEADEDTLAAAYGQGVTVLTPENKHWLLKQMGFNGLGKGKWKHILFDEEITFDLDHGTLVQLAFQIHKTGYKNAHTEWESQQKRTT